MSQVLEMRPAQYAEHRGVSREAIRKAIDAGRIPKEAIRIDAAQVKWIDVARADVALAGSASRVTVPDEKISPAVAAGEGSADPAAPSLTAARTSSELYAAEIRRLDFEERIGKLLKAEDVARAMERWAEAAVREVDQLPTHADDLAAAFTRGGVDEVRRILREISRSTRDAIEKNMRLLGSEDVADLDDEQEVATQ